MPDFSVDVSPVTVESWGDPPYVHSGLFAYHHAYTFASVPEPERTEKARAAATMPSRINPLPGLAPLRARVPVNTQVTLTCTVGGVAGPMDAALGGRLFTGFCLEHSSAARPPMTHPVNQTSVQRFTPTEKGHYTVEVVRDGKMAVVVHVDAL
jgi:hypothetical protein